MTSNSLEELPEPNSGFLQLLNDVGILGVLHPPLVKAVSKIVCGAADIPAAWLESFADDIRSTSEARRHLRVEAAKSMAEQFETNPPLAARALAQNASKIIQEQVTAEEIVKIAIDDLAKTTAAPEFAGDPDDDWLAAFRSEAVKRTAPEIKYAFGKILSGEIQNPGKFSIRTLYALSGMDQELASLFRTLCNMTLVVPDYDATVLSLDGNAGDNSLAEFGLSFGHLTVLQENGLIISDLNSWRDYARIIKNGLPMSYAGRSPTVLAMEGMKSVVKLHGVSLTSVGYELYFVVDLEENTTYTSRLVTHFAKHRINFGLI